MDDAEAITAAALVFHPDIAPPARPLNLSRAGRGTEAFVGYDEGLTEHFYVRTDDRQRDGSGGFGPFFRGDRYERRAVSVKTGVRYR